MTRQDPPQQPRKWYSIQTWDSGRWILTDNLETTEHQAIDRAHELHSRRPRLEIYVQDFDTDEIIYRIPADLDADRNRRRLVKALICALLFALAPGCATLPTCTTDTECHQADHARGITDHGNQYHGHPPWK